MLSSIFGRRRRRSDLRATALALVITGFISGIALATDAKTARRPLLVTVDDLPVAAGSMHTDPVERERITRGLLAVLAKHNVQAVGFVIWGSVRSEADRAILGRWLAAGHELGNHSRGHLDYPLTATDDYVADVDAGRAGLEAFLAPHGRHVRFFRFPFLREGDTEPKLDAMRKYLDGSGQRNMPVTIDNQDWSFEERWVKARQTGDAKAMSTIADEYQLALRSEIIAQTELGDELFERAVPQVLLLHANEVGSAQWDSLFTWIEERGYRFAAADELIGDSAIASLPRFVSRYGGSHWNRVARVRNSERVRARVQEALDAQVAAWNRGDLDSFCAGYADDAVFLSPSGITNGRQAVLDRYRAKYPTQAAMGTLTIEPLDVREAWGSEVSSFGDALPSRTHGVSIAGRWTLKKSDGTTATGLTLIVFHRRGDKWLVVQDASM